MSRTIPAVLFTVLLSACGERAQPALAFRPVVADALRELERALPEPPASAVPDMETVSRVRARAESLAADAGPLRPMIALSATDFGDAAAPVLAQMLGEANLAAPVRVAAAELLAALDSPAGAAALVYHATSNPVSWVRAQCVWRLASTTQDQCVLPLLEAVPAERDAQARTYFASTLAHFGCPDFGAPDASTAPTQRLELAVWRRLATLRGKADPSGTRADVIDALGRVPTAFAPRFAEALGDEDGGVRSAAAGALAGMGPRASVAGPALLASLLGDPAIEVEATSALGAIHHTAAAAEIEKRLVDRARPLALRVAAARALGRLDVTRAADALAAAHAGGEPPQLRLAAAGALCALGRADLGFTTLIEGLRGSDATAAAADVDHWLAGLDRSGNEAARRLRARRAEQNTTPAELADLLAAARADLVR
jgi:HEAT repeat protein